MKRLTMTQRFTRQCVVAPAMLATACSSGAPTAPSASANLAITDLAITRTPTATGFAYAATFLLREVGGRTGLQLTSMSLTFTGDGGVTAGFSINTLPEDVMAPGQTEPWTLTSRRTDAYTSGSVSVGYTDDHGGTGLVTATSRISGVSPPS